MKMNGKRFKCLFPEPYEHFFNLLLGRFGINIPAEELFANEINALYQGTVKVFGNVLFSDMPDHT